MTTYTIKNDQTIFDVALQLYGDASKVFDLIAENASINTLLQNVNGLQIIYDETIFNSTSTFFTTNQIVLVTGSRLMIDNVGSFDSSFDNSFL